GSARQLFSISRLTNVGGTEIEGVLGRVNVDCVKKLSVEHLDAGDVAVAQRRQLLHQRHSIDAEVDPATLCRLRQCSGIVETRDARSAATDVWLHHNRESEPASRLWRQRRVVDDANRGVGKPELLENIELQRFRGLHLVAGGAV